MRGLVTATHKHTIEELLRKLTSEFKITSRPVGYFLNVLIISAGDISQRVNMKNANAFSTPIEKCQLTREVTDHVKTTAPFRKAVGCYICQ